MNDTGITECANATTNGLACNDAMDGTDLFPEQDAEYGRDVTHNDDSDGRAGFSFTKLGSDGSALAIQNGVWSDSGSEVTGTKWSCIEDNVTGLIWEVKTNNDTPDLHDMEWSYSWYSTDAASNGGEVGTADAGDNCLDDSRCDTEKYVADVNAAALCGFTDWRLPEREELRSIFDYSKSVMPSIDADWFPNSDAVVPWVWTVSTYAYNDETTKAWLLNFNGTGDSAFGKSMQLHIRLVSGGV
ncbi:DUF1566 domain-containing protein [Candidatus Reidiella endopervernicosa]|uniref:DUF1566 domain-containing protein n=1 Tax=Candidatus Reidiella endopervernicosa TaxID=2738883 RepID=A0A6N0HZI9_9GAMM|nr:DUF1566 domain-containing protein [Candidatus Reidiella endopervernicosa]QKQ27797.1 DUF1566 domain-containing protein [Candidatus Reidiella endopervernicosa]